MRCPSTCIVLDSREVRIPVQCDWETVDELHGGEWHTVTLQVSDGVAWVVRWRNVIPPDDDLAEAEVGERVI